MYKFILMFIMVLFISSTAFAERIQLPSGTYINIDNLTPEEIKKAIELDRKASGKFKEEAVETVSSVVKQIDPTKLDEWRKLITGTIKDICNDLNVSVNEFIKTPAGMGVAALIIYKVAGKEILSDAMDVIVMIPLWLFTTGLLLYLSWYCFSYKIVYQNINYNEKGKQIKSDPISMNRYDWSNHSSSAKSIVLGWFLAIEIIMTLITLCLVLG